MSEFDECIVHGEPGQRRRLMLGKRQSFLHVLSRINSWLVPGDAVGAGGAFVVFEVAQQ